MDALREDLQLVGVTGEDGGRGDGGRGMEGDDFLWRPLKVKRRRSVSGLQSNSGVTSHFAESVLSAGLSAAVDTLGHIPLSSEPTGRSGCKNNHDTSAGTAAGLKPAETDTRSASVWNITQRSRVCETGTICFSHLS